VDDQSRDPASLLNRIERLIRLRKVTPEFGRGDWRMIDTGVDAVLAIAATLAGRTTVAIHNLTGEERRTNLPMDDLGGGSLVFLLGEGTDAPDEANGSIAVGPFAYGWFRVAN